LGCHYIWHLYGYNNIRNGQTNNHNTQDTMGVLMEREVLGSRLWVINMYQEQLRKFEKIGIGKKTEHGVTVTEKLINITEHRLHELALVYDSSKRPDTLRARQFYKTHKEKLLNGQINSNGTVEAQSSKSNSSDRHARKKS